jgi:predicted nuclease of predicted toxin-antitoxin system
MKCLFDNNLPSKLSKALCVLEGDDGLPVIHLSDKFPPNTPDVEWMRILAAEGDWFVVTRDNQIKKRPHERMAWKESNLPIVFLSKTWMNFNFWEISWRLVKCWQNIKESVTSKHSSVMVSVNGKVENA